MWVPLPTSTSVAQLRSFVAETKPSVIASSIDYHAEAVELALTVHTPTRLVVFDYHPGVDDERARGLRCRQVAAGAVEPSVVPDDKDPLKLLIYTSGSTGAPKGAMYPEHLVANFWRRSSGSVAQLPRRRSRSTSCP